MHGNAKTFFHNIQILHRKFPDDFHKTVPCRGAWRIKREVGAWRGFQAIRNFGEKSLEELKTQLREKGFMDEDGEITEAEQEA